MTNEEAVKELLYYATLDDSGFEPHMKEYAKQIQKDLEVSEILKKYLFIVEPDNEEDFKEFDSVDYLRLADFMSRDEYQIIKEWLYDK